MKIIQKTIYDEYAAEVELIEYLKKNMNIEPIADTDFLETEIIVPDLRGFPLNFIPETDRNLKNVNMDNWHLESANLVAARLETADLSFAHLESADLHYAHLESTILAGAHFESAILERAHFEMALLTDAHLESANLSYAHVESAYLEDAHLESANFSSAFLYKKDYVPAEKLVQKFEGNEQLVEIEMKADFTGATFKPRFWHQLYRFKLSRYRHYFKPRKWQLPKYGPGFPFNTRRPFKMKETALPLIFGRLKTANFLGVSTEGVDWSGNRMLERYIKDQQFIDEFRRNHRVLYLLWNATSKCGQSVPRLAFWILFVIFGFALIFHNFEVVNLLQQEKLPGFWAPLYTSVNIFSNLGMGIKEPASKIGAVLIMIETMFGFVALGLLLTVAGSRFARRS
ncbi:MAG: pentapeptide repeat-containing protein [candidate division Zixibacteria bacterium]